MALSRLQEFLNNVLSIVMTPNMLIFGHSENVYLAQLWLKFNTMTFLAINKSLMIQIVKIWVVEYVHVWAPYSYFNILNYSLSPDPLMSTCDVYRIIVCWVIFLWLLYSDSLATTIQPSEKPLQMSFNC